MGSLLFKTREDLELIVSNLAKWRVEGLGPEKMVPLSVVVAETKINKTISDVEDLIQILAKISNVKDKY